MSQSAHSSLLTKRGTALVTLQRPSYFTGRNDVQFGRLGALEFEGPTHSVKVDYFDLCLPAHIDTIRASTDPSIRPFAQEEVIALVATLTNEASDVANVPLLCLGRGNRNLFFSEGWDVEVTFTDHTWRIRYGVRIFTQEAFGIYTRVFSRFMPLK